MDEKQELQELLKRLDESNRKQARYAKWQCVFSVAAAVCCIALLVVVCTLMPQVRELTAQTETVLENLEIVTAQLADMELGDMIRNVDSLVTTSQDSLEQMMAKLNIIDFESLNQAIRNLSDVVEPLAKFFNVFN